MSYKFNNRIVITSASVITSVGMNLTETWDSLLNGTHGIREIKDHRQKGFVGALAAQVSDLSPAELKVPPRNARIMDKHSYMLLKCTREAFNESGIRENFASDEIGFFAGMGMVDYNIEDLLPAVIKSMDKSGYLDYDLFYSEGFREIHPLWPLSSMNNVGFCQVAIEMNIRGDNTVFAPHADSAVHAIIESCDSLIRKRSRVILAGGVSEKVSPLSMARFELFGMLNTSEDINAAGCHPFGRDRSGAVPGEGCGILTLELLDTAIARNVSPVAIISGYGSSCELSNSAQCPTANAISLSMRGSLSCAGVSPSDIDMIIAHGEGTIDGDRNEAAAINEVFADCIDNIDVYSSKGALGHLQAGGPAVDIALGLSILQHGIIPPVSNASDSDASVKFNVVHDKPVKKPVRRILINAFSCEGQCCSLILEKPET